MPFQLPHTSLLSPRSRLSQNHEHGLRQLFLQHCDKSGLLAALPMRPMSATRPGAVLFTGRVKLEYQLRYLIIYTHPERWELPHSTYGCSTAWRSREPPESVLPWHHTSKRSACALLAPRRKDESRLRRMRNISALSPTLRISSSFRCY